MKSINQLEINKKHLMVSVQKQCYESKIWKQIHCITEYYLEQGICWKPEHSSKFRPILESKKLLLIFMVMKRKMVDSKMNYISSKTKHSSYDGNFFKNVISLRIKTIILLLKFTVFVNNG